MVKRHNFVPSSLVIVLCWCGVFGLTALTAQPAAAQEGANAAKDDAKAHSTPAKKEAAVLHAGPAESPHDENPHDAAGAHGKKNPYDPLEWKGELALWSFITFLIFVVVLRVFAWGPLANALDAREAKIHGNIAHAEAARLKAESMLADYQAKLAAAQDEVIKTMAEARRDAEQTRQQILAQTEKDVAALKDRALLEIERTKDAALNELFAHMAGTVASATEKVLGRTLTDADQDRLVNDALVEFSRQQAS